MERENALRQLRDMRDEIVEIYAGLDRCKTLQGEVEKRMTEKKNPAPYAFSAMPEHTADALRAKFLAENRQRMLNSHVFERTVHLVQAVFLAVVTVMFALDCLLVRNFFVDVRFLLDQVPDFTAGDPSVFFLVAVHAALSALSVVWSAGNLKGKKRKVLLLTAATVVLGLIYLAWMLLCSAFMYPVLIIGSALLVAGILAAERAVRKKKAENPVLTAEQERAVEVARQNDAAATEENAKNRAEAERVWKEHCSIREKELDGEMEELRREFAEIRKEIDGRAERLQSMDILAENDKNLQTIEMLIHFLETRRADSVKEALQEYDKLMANRQLMELEQKKLKAELLQAEQAHADRVRQAEEERRHHAEMEYYAKDNAASRKKISDQLDYLGTMLYYDVRY